MRLVFADTGYWIALLNPRDTLHLKAIILSKRLQSTHIITSEMVLTEVLTAFAKFDPVLRLAAIRLIEELKSMTNVTIVPQTSQQFQQALSLYAERLDKAWSLTDCSSFKIMAAYRITDALAYDKHFAQAGFTPLLREHIS
ncbi:MAG: PIN domain-containing protein [Cyanobacteria bacterium P01_H01_bin.21]